MIDTNEPLTRQYAFRLRESELAYLEACASAEGITMSDVVRLGLGLDPTPKGRNAWRPKPKAAKQARSTRSATKKRKS